MRTQKEIQDELELVQSNLRATTSLQEAREYIRQMGVLIIELEDLFK